MYTGASTSGQGVKQGSWYTRTVTIPFTFYETR
jgi:hypothetical protein